MKIKAIVALEEVKQDIKEGENFYNLQDIGIGNYFKDSIISDIESLWVYAGIHIKHFGIYRMLATKFPYLIYYNIQKEICVIVAILHMRKNPNEIKDNLEQRV